MFFKASRPLFTLTLAALVNPLVAPLAVANTPSEPTQIVIALKPDKNPDQMAAEKKLLQDSLGKKIGLPVKVMIPTSAAVILQGFANGTVDLGYLSSLDMVNAERAKAADVLLVGRIKGRTFYESIWLVRNDKTYSNIQDLRGKPVAMASRTSTSGYLIPYWDLIERKLVKAKEHPEAFFGTGNVWFGTGYVTAVQRVLDGTAEAAAVSDYVFLGDKHLSAEQKQKLKILQRQGPVPTHVMAARRTLSPELRQKVVAAIRDLTPELRDKVFTSELVEQDANTHLATTRKALELTGLVLETK